jgi:hypothetical protein
MNHEEDGFSAEYGFFPTDVHDPQTNVCDAYKEMALLEDHLFKPDRDCQDCIRKHLLKIEGFGDECITLDRGRDYPVCVDLALESRRWRAMLNQGATYPEVAQSIRKLRKEVGRQIPVGGRAVYDAGRAWKQWAVPVAVGAVAAWLYMRRA